MWDEMGRSDRGHGDAMVIVEEIKNLGKGDCENHTGGKEWEDVKHWESKKKVPSNVKTDTSRKTAGKQQRRCQRRVISSETYVRQSV